VSENRGEKSRAVGVEKLEKCAPGAAENDAACIRT